MKKKVVIELKLRRRGKYVEEYDYNNDIMIKI